MNLLEQSEQGHLLRCNLMRLLVSGVAANRQLALTMMETGGVPMVAIRELRKLLKGHDSRYPGPPTTDVEVQLERLLDAGMAALPQNLQTCLRSWRDPEIESGKGTKQRLAWDQPETFEKTVSEGLITWEQWADFWRIDDSWLMETCLTGILLRQGYLLHPTDFLQKHPSGHAMRKPWLGQLLSDHPDFDFQLACLKLLLDGNTLNLSGTSLTEVPDAACKIENIEAIAIGGTSIDRLPQCLLTRIQRVEGRKSQIRAIEMQAMEDGHPNGPIRRRAFMRIGLAHYEAKNFDSAFHFLHASTTQDGSSPLKQRGWSDYMAALFGSAIETGHWDVAVSVLDAMASNAHDPHPATKWKGWDVWNGLILIAGVEAKFVGTIHTLLFQNFTNPNEHVGFPWVYHWAHIFERLLYERSLDTALAFLRRAMTLHPTMTLQMFRWNRILCHFKHLSQWTEIWRLLHFIDSEECHLLPGTTDEGLNDPRTMKDAFLALSALHELDLMNRYFGRMIRKYQNVLRKGNKVDAWSRRTWANRMHMMWRVLQSHSPHHRPVAIRLTIQ
jgi:hypothetical protein